MRNPRAFLRPLAVGAPARIAALNGGVALVLAGIALGVGVLAMAGVVLSIGAVAAGLVLFGRAVAVRTVAA